MADTVPVVRERAAAITAYRLILYAMLREIRRELNASAVPALMAERRHARDAESWFVSMRSTLAAAQASAIDKVTALVERESASFSKRLGRAFQRATGLDLAAWFGQRPEKVLDTYIAANASLIRSLGDDTAKRLEGIIYRALLNNTPMTQVSVEIQRALQISRSRADLIATDQIASLNSDLTAHHAKRTGVKEYVWRGRLDRRERPLHVSLEGRRYRIGQRTGAEHGLPPGKPVRCRCHAQLILPKRSTLQKLIEFATGAAIGIALSENGVADE